MSLYTEAEARERWCPETRIARMEPLDVIGPAYIGMVQIVGGVNRDALGRTGVSNRHCKCIASECMVWRWAKGKDGNSALLDQRQGYCGKGGEP